jgi:hypothetical protein
LPFSGSLSIKFMDGYPGTGSLFQIGSAAEVVGMAVSDEDEGD